MKCPAIQGLPYIYGSTRVHHDIPTALSPIVYSSPGLRLVVPTEASGASCYASLLPSIPPSTDHRPVPWGSPSVHFSSLNGTLTTCCDSLDEIRNALDDIDGKLLDLLNQRAAYVREATRFKPTRDSVNVPSRNEEVVQQAEQQAEHIGVPVIIARATFEAILNSSVPFEQCIFDTSHP
ncbi:Chorismate mutase [Penicillium maclennaniae]|uniref:Chorismate mutase n=1 Tax=Penicillium maclennaniae TaxID=1343394 RepID=UPI002540D267|nr:Chorismate mutase [Penicillium maclennaniae]KAJ5664880.1 Chorismate mutase [Penicillium maclennaniae]